MSGITRYTLDELMEHATKLGFNPHAEQFSESMGREYGATTRVGFKRLSPDATLPTRAHATDSGFDLYAVEDVIIEPGETAVVKTGIAVQLPEDCEAQVRPRSGVTSRTKLRVQLGTVDRGYTGEIGVIVDNVTIAKTYMNDGFDIAIPKRKHALTISGERQATEQVHDDGSYIIRKGDKIAQLVVQHLPQVEAVEIDGELAETSRGGGGFGSTDK